MMTKGFLQAEIDKLQQFSEYSQVVKEAPPSKEELAKMKKQEAERKKGAKKQKVSASSSKSSKPKAAALEKFEQETEGPAVNMEEYASLIGKGLAVAEQYNLADMSELTKLNVHLTENGGWELFPTPKDGQCMFSAFRRGMDLPEEYRNNHLRYQVVYFITQNHGFCFTVLKSILLAEYGHLRLTEQEYCKKLMDNTLTDEEEERYEKPGPFSLITYLEHLLDPSSWGDHGVLLMISMMWQVTITVLVAESLKMIRIRHSRELDRADFLLVLAGKNHYLGTCEFNFCLLLLFPDVVAKCARPVRFNMADVNGWYENVRGHKF